MARGRDAAGDGAALTGFSCGKFWMFSRFRERTIQSPYQSDAARSPGSEIVPARLLLGQWLIRDAIPVGTVPRVLFDLSRELMPEQVANVIHEAEFHKLFDPRAIRRATPVLRKHSRCTRAATPARGRPRGPVPETHPRRTAPRADHQHAPPRLRARLPLAGAERRDRRRPPRPRKDQARRPHPGRGVQAHGFVVLRFREEDLDRPEEVLRRLAARL